ncbi:MAG TPA: hypothetical protein VJL87_02820 [Bdellovibrionota bacterium]|nr:hypothetical protein [Bdellovibrionota bacterium]
MGKTFRLILTAFIVGMWLAMIQLALIYVLNIRFASTVSVYLMLFGAWLIGMTLGLLVKHLHYFFWASFGMLTMSIFTLSSIFELPNTFLNIWALITAVFSAGWGMSFIREFSPYYPTSRSILFWENNGFILGIVLAVGFLIYGGLLVSAVAGIGVLIVPWLPRLFLGPPKTDLSSFEVAPFGRSSQ